MPFSSTPNAPHLPVPHLLHLPLRPENLRPPCHIQTGEKVLTHIKGGFKFDVFVNTSLIDFYVKCGRVGDAWMLFDEIPVRNVVSRMAIISPYIADGRLNDALGLFRKMLNIGFVLDSFNLVRVLNICSQLGDLKSGEWVYRCVEDTGKDKNLFVANSVIDMYAKCVSMEKVRGVFDAMAERDVVTWSIMIGGYSSNGLPQAVLELFSRMQDVNVMSDCYTMVAILSVCGKLGDLEMGH